MMQASFDLKVRFGNKSGSTVHITVPIYAAAQVTGSVILLVY